MHSCASSSAVRRAALPVRPVHDVERVVERVRRLRRDDAEVRQERRERARVRLRDHLHVNKLQNNVIFGKKKTLENVILNDEPIKIVVTLTPPKITYTMPQ